MGLFICCVSNSHLESRMNPQMPDTQFTVFLNVKVFQDGKQAMLSKSIYLGTKGKWTWIHQKKNWKLLHLDNISELYPKKEN